MNNPVKNEDFSSLFTIEQLKERLAPLFHLPEIQLVMLFGSAASESLRADSDLDFAILGDHVLDLVGLTNTFISLLHCNRVDLVDLRHSSPLLMREVVRTGKLLFEQTPGTYVTFCSLAHRRYVDTAKLRTAQQASIHHFLHSRGLE